eukprot:3798994-Amphidinium_carterae.3
MFGRNPIAVPPQSQFPSSQVHSNHSWVSVSLVPFAHQLFTHSSDAAAVSVAYWSISVLAILPLVAAAALVSCASLGVRGARAPVLRDPPFWQPGDEERHPFRHYLQDVSLWLLHSELDPVQQCAAIISQLGRLLARELSPQEIMYGGLVQGVHLDPVSYLLNALQQRFAPLSEETRLRATSSLLQFQRQNNESVDSLLSRFELVRMRASAEGGGTLGVEPASLILLRAVGVSQHQYLNLIQPFGNRLPQSEQELSQMCHAIRRLGHVIESFPNNIGASFRGQGSSSQGRQGHFHADIEDAAWSGDEPQWESPFASALPQTGEGQWSFAAYGESEDTSTATDEELDGEYSYLADAGEDPNLEAQRLYWQYHQAKRRWRRFTGKPPRRYRRMLRGGHAKGKGKSASGSPTGRSFWSEAWSSYYKGKGKGKGKSKSNSFRRNPRGKDGQPMRCHRCGSTEHLIAKCPVQSSNAAGTTAVSSSPPQQAHHASTRAEVHSPPDLGSMERHSTEPAYTPGRAQQAGVLLAHFSTAEVTKAGASALGTADSSWLAVDAPSSRIASTGDNLMSSGSSLPTTALAGAHSASCPSWHAESPWPRHEQGQCAAPFLDPQRPEVQEFEQHLLSIHQQPDAQAPEWSYAPQAPMSSTYPVRGRAEQHFQNSWDSRAALPHSLPLYRPPVAAPPVQMPRRTPTTRNNRSSRMPDEQETCRTGDRQNRRSRSIEHAAHVIQRLREMSLSTSYSMPAVFGDPSSVSAHLPARTVLQQLREERRSRHHSSSQKEDRARSEPAIGRGLCDPSSRATFAGSGMMTDDDDLPSNYDGDVDTCVLCQESFQDRDRVCRLPCRHVYHCSCFEDLLSRVRSHCQYVELCGKCQHSHPRNDYPSTSQSRCKWTTHTDWQIVVAAFSTTLTE